MGAESEQPPSDGREPRRPGEDRHERFGPLELLRTSKADGRALLLFSRREEGPGGEEQA
jgi:hypothetical protein